MEKGAGLSRGTARHFKVRSEVRFCPSRANADGASPISVNPGWNRAKMCQEKTLAGAAVAPLGGLRHESSFGANRPRSGLTRSQAPDLSRTLQPLDIARRPPKGFEHSRGVRSVQFVLNSSVKIGPNRTQRWPSNFII
jgi:hypothetical protein